MLTPDGYVVDPVLGVIDTSPQMRAIMIEGFRKMSGLRKMELVDALNRQALSAALTDIVRKHPGASDRECLLRLASRCYDAEILRSLCGWDVDVEGY